MDAHQFEQSAIRLLLWIIQNSQYAECQTEHLTVYYRCLVYHLSLNLEHSILRSYQQDYQYAADLQIWNGHKYILQLVLVRCGASALVGSSTFVSMFGNIRVNSVEI